MEESRWQRLARRLRPDQDAVDPTLWSMLPWLGLPYLISAELARAGHGLPGEVLPVAAFLPLVALAYVAAMALRTKRRPWFVGGVGAAVLLGLVVRLFTRSDYGAGQMAIGVAVAATALVVTACWLAGRRWIPLLAMPMTLALVLSQGLDGWLTYLAVGNPFGWLAEPAREQVHVSAFILRHAPLAFPLLKVALAIAVAYGLRKVQDPSVRLALAVAVCYVGLQPFLFSAANLLDR